MNDNELEMTNKEKREMVLGEFRQWNSSEQAIFLADALKITSFSLAKFIATVCAELISQTNKLNGESHFSCIMEDQANDISFFQVLNDKSTETKLKFLNSYLPLLQLAPNNDSQHLKEQLRDTYNEQIQSILQECTFEAKFLAECRQVLTFALAHPIFDSTHKESYQKWIDLIDKAEGEQEEVGAENAVLSNSEPTTELEAKSKISPLPSISINVTTSISALTGNEDDDVDDAEEQPEKTVVSKSTKLFLERASSSPMEQLTSFNLIKKSNLNNSLEELQAPTRTSAKDSISKIYKMNSSSSSTEAHSTTTTNTQNFNNSMSLKNENPGMKSVTQWLKNIKLHKYTCFFENMTYEELVGLNDQKMIDANITLGARKKILGCIDKITERPARLKQLIQILDDKKCPINNSMADNILIELSEISMSPIEPSQSMPTTIKYLNGYGSQELFRTSNSNTCQLIIDLIDKINTYLLKQQHQYLIKNDFELKELLKLCMKIIDKLFLTKAFSDIQNLHMSKQRASFNEQLQSLQLASHNADNNNSNNNNSKSFLKPYSSRMTLRKTNSWFPNNSQTGVKSDLNSGNFNNRLPAARSPQPAFKQNSINARQRIQNKNLKSALGKTMSAPYHTGFQQLETAAKSYEDEFKSNPFVDSK